MYDIDRLVEAYWATVWENQCAEQERYEEAVENACDEMESAYETQSKLQGWVDEGYNDDEEKELTDDEIDQLQAEIDQLDEDMSRIANEYGVQLSDCRERLWQRKRAEINQYIAKIKKTKED